MTEWMSRSARGGKSVRRAVRGVSWYVTSLMGDRAYDTWVTHLANEHPDQPPVSEREFWAARYREQESTPGARCC